MKEIYLSGFLSLWIAVAWGQSGEAGYPDSASQQRQDIAAVRASGFAALDADDQECQKKFAVFDCQREVARRRRALDAELKARERVLNDAQRKQRGAEQLRRVEQKQSERARAQSQAPSSATPTEPILPKVHGPTGTASPSDHKNLVTHTSEEDKAAARAAYLHKQDAARKRKAEREKRVLESGTPGVALPVPQ